MKSEEFDKQVHEQIKTCLEILTNREPIYAGREDRLENFKKAGELQNVNPETALFGMLAKHLIALSDFVIQLQKGIEPFIEGQWEEKITDSINYLFLLKGLLKERGNIL